MPSYMTRQSIAAGAAVNILQGAQYEFLPFHANVRFGLVGDATGLVGTVYAGTDLLMEEGPLDFVAAGRLPVDPDNFHLDDDVAAGDRLKVLVRNPTAGAINEILILKITPMG